MLFRSLNPVLEMILLNFCDVLIFFVKIPVIQCFVLFLKKCLNSFTFVKTLKYSIMNI